MAAGWGTALQSGVNGYLTGLQIAKLSREQQDADQLKADLKAAGQQVAVEQTGGQPQIPEWADNRDAGTPEMQALPNSGLVDTPVALKVAGQSYATRAEADAAAAKANTPAAMAQRASAVYGKHGQMDKAMAMQQQAMTMERQQAEMTETAMRLKKAGVMESLAKFRMTGDPASAKAALAGAGFPISGDVKVEPVELDVPGLGKMRTFKAMFAMKDGDKEIPAEIDAHQATMAMMPYEQVLQNQRQGVVDQRTQANADRTFNEGVRQFDVTNSRLTAGQAQESELRGLQIGKARLDLEEATRNAKVPAAVRLQAETLKKESEAINAAITKSQADGSWSPDSPGAKQLLERRAILTEQLNRTLAPYVPSESKGSADPFGLRGGAPVSFKDPAWDKAEAEASQKTGVPAEILRVVRTLGERSNGDQVSPKGARGVYQFIPESREAFKKKYGVDAYSDNPADQALAAAYHLKEGYDRTGSWEKAAAGFNGGISAEKGKNATAENKAYRERTGSAIAAAMQQQADPMEELYRKQVGEMNRGTRADLSSDVKDWLARRDDDKKQRFNAAQAAYLQKEKDRALRESKVLAANARP
ncbi:transglycosylase SLT domain-containing protein [Pseudacidovorax intermedius]|uniref:transglycosylase SLT domain-containing protein n=1 Tax=Pseudacidovorax intermedius TaxID=433924 RepID=UPI00034989C8|nr:transglycosylase SLT domain-containing protein [Pseudacidovorax intermedius]